MAAFSLGFDPSKREDKGFPSFDIPSSGATTRAQGQEDERKKLALDFSATGNGNPAGFVNASVWNNRCDS